MVNQPDIKLNLASSEGTPS